MGSEHTPSRKPWYPGFDWLRAAFIACVVAMHLDVCRAAAGEQLPMTVADVIFFAVPCLAVPGFLLLSSFLCESGTYDLRKRGRQWLEAFSLYVFWVGLWVLHTKVRPAPGFGGVLEFLLRGGGWAFYFFAALLIQRTLAFGTGRLSHRAGLVGGLVVLAALEIGLGWGGKAWWAGRETYWWPICFLAAPFLGRWLAGRFQTSVSAPPVWWLAVAAIGAFVFELWVAPHSVPDPERRFLPDYLRASPMLAVAALLGWAIRVNKPAPAVVRFVARNSLGIFVLHCFVLRGVHGALRRVLHLDDAVLARCLTLVVVVAGGAVAAELVRHLLRQRLI